MCVILYEIEVAGLAAKIRQARKNKRGKVDQLSREAGIHRATWYGIESGSINRISEPILRGIERALGVDLGLKLCCDRNQESNHVHKEGRPEYDPD
ncbi:MAG: helix-turn-helix transcriptional regulator [Moorea sp. SIO3C2]|nr:helix-turn-helix transcriptional regulator [Moorena sp. SIO3C2]